MAVDLRSSSAARIGGPDRVLTEDDVRGFVRDQLDGASLTGRTVLVIVPDGTRSCPLPLLVEAIHAALAGRVRRLSFLVALGTHPAMSEAALAEHLGYRHRALDERFPQATVSNHAWWDPSALKTVGTIPAERIGELSGGLLSTTVRVEVNRAVLENEVTLVVGPVFPHEVAGFSGGNKYLFPGVSGQELTDVSHWLGALLTSAEIIGTRGTTPVRALIDEAASMLPGERLALSVVTVPGSDQLHAACFGTPEASFDAAVEVAAATHIRYLDAPVERVLSFVPERYDDLWTGAKGFYKVEPVVADGGEVILYALHIDRISATHPAIETIGYHCRDYFVSQWDRFKDNHWGDLAHSTHLRGSGTYDPLSGERCRVRVTLATSIPEQVVRSVNLGYLDPATIDPSSPTSSLAGGTDTLVVYDAGEQLYRLR